MKKLLIGLSITFVLFVTAGCTKRTSQIEPADISIIRFENLSCKQLKEEFIDVNKRLAVLSVKQDKAADNYVAGALLMGTTGIFNPYLVDVDYEADIASLKGKDKAIRNIATKKNCSFVNDLRDLK